MRPWPDLYSLKKLTRAYCPNEHCQISPLSRIQATYNRGSEGTIEPTPALANELSGRLRHIGLCFTRLHVGERPLFVRFRDELEAQDTILGQEHVFGEDVHSVDTFGSQTIGE